MRPMPEVFRAECIGQASNSLEKVSTHLLTSNHHDHHDDLDDHDNDDHNHDLDGDDHDDEDDLFHRLFFSMLV